MTAATSSRTCVPLSWRVYRPSIFDEVSFRYRLLWVPKEADGSTRPLVTGELLEALGTAVTLDLPS
jgi:hypothetical protein